MNNDPVLSRELRGGPVPPNLHWALVLFLTVITLGIFAVVWMFVEASFAQRLRTRSKPLFFYGLGIALSIAGALGPDNSDLKILFVLTRFAGNVLLICGHFSLKNALEDYYNRVEKIGLQLSGVMTFFFNVVYFQYHLSKIHKWKTTGNYDLGVGTYTDTHPKKGITYTQSELDAMRNQPPQA